MSTTTNHPETLAEAAEWDAVRDGWAEQGWCPACASSLAWGGKAERSCRICARLVSEEGRAVLRHLAGWSDQLLATDLDCALAALSAPGDVAAVKAYAKARKAAPGWNAKRQGNTHRAIPADVLEQIRAGATAQTKMCSWCGAAFLPTGRQAYCTGACRRTNRNHQRGR